jgi:hypothetical protein
MKILKITTSILLILLSYTITAQETAIKKWKFAFQLDNRFSNIKNSEITIFGAKAGMQYKNRTRFGLGFSFITNPVTIDFFNKKAKQSETSNINLWYISVFNDWILYKNKDWECFVTEQVGYGKPNFTREINDEIVSDLNIGLYVNEISGQVNYKFNNWIGVGAGIGHRNILNKDARLKATLDAPIYIIKVIVYPEVFFK